MFVCGKRYRHINCLDVDIDVLAILKEDIEAVYLRIWYWNRHSNFHYDIDEVRVLKKDYSKWARISY